MTAYDLAPIVRIILRYLMVPIAAYSPGMAASVGVVVDDPIILQSVTGLLIFLLSEGWYAVAKRNGNPT